MDKYYELEIKTTQEEKELLMDYLYDVGVEGIEVIESVTGKDYKDIKGDYADLSYLEDIEGVTLKGYIKEIVFLGNRGLIEEKLPDLKATLIEDTSWLTAYKEYFHPVSVGERFVVVPVWESYDPSPEELIILIDPGIAFGTGTHETTKNMLELMEKVDFKGKKVADVGTGSGILTIGALKLGAEEVLAIDVDEDAVSTAKSNIELNHFATKGGYALEVGHLLDGVDKKFHIILANIVADAIIELGESAYEHLKKEGWFLVSGIIEERFKEVDAALKEAGFLLDVSKEDNGWVTAVYRKESHE